MKHPLLTSVGCLPGLQLPKRMSAKTHRAMNASSRIFKDGSRERSPGLRIYTVGKCECEGTASVVERNPQGRKIFLAEFNVTFAHVSASN
jgi:hypothetical protein